MGVGSMADTPDITINASHYQQRPVMAGIKWIPSGVAYATWAKAMREHAERLAATEKRKTK